MKMTSLPSIAIPGQRLGAANSYAPGPGTHLKNSSIYASISGPVVLHKADPKRRLRGTLTVARSYAQTLTHDHSIPPTNGQITTTAAPSNAPKLGKNYLKFNTLPAVESVVLGRITRVQKRQAAITILVVLDENSFFSSIDSDDINALLASTPTCTNADNNNADELRYQALIRKEDVRAVEKDRVVMDDMFRVGDIVRASVISLGDQSAYYCSTARNELGVVIAMSEEGNMMFPISWKEMKDPITGATEVRKVARPF